MRSAAPLQVAVSRGAAQQLAELLLMEDELLGPSPIVSPHGELADGIPLVELSETDESPSPVEYDTGDYETGASAHDLLP